MTDTEYAPMDMRRSLQPVGRTFAASQTATPAAILAMKGLPASTRAILLAITNIADGSLILVLPDGRRLRFGDADGPCATMQIHSHRFAKRVLAEGDIGFAEGWLENESDQPRPDNAALATRGQR